MKKMNVVAVAVVMAGSVLLGAVAQAEPKMAVLDAQAVINETNAAKRAIDALKKDRDAAQAKINQLEAPLAAKQKQLAEQQNVLSPDKFKAAQDDFRKEVGKFRADAGNIQEKLDEKNLKLRKQIADAVRGVVEKLAKEKGYDVVLPKAMLFYTSANVPDISDEVLKRSNAVLDK